MVTNEALCSDWKRKNPPLALRFSLEYWTQQSNKARGRGRSETKYWIFAWISLVSSIWRAIHPDSGFQNDQNSLDFASKPFPRLYPFSSFSPRLAFSFFLQWSQEVEHPEHIRGIFWQIHWNIQRNTLPLPVWRSRLSQCTCLGSCPCLSPLTTKKMPNSSLYIFYLKSCICLFVNFVDYIFTSL